MRRLLQFRLSVRFPDLRVPGRIPHHHLTLTSPFLYPLPNLSAPSISISQDDPITPSSLHRIIVAQFPGMITFYTTDGSDPTMSSTPYTNPFAIDTPAISVVIKARSYAPGYQPSPIACSLPFTVVDTSPATPAIPLIASRAPGIYAITSSTDGASIYYTTNGKTPTADSAIYSIPLSIIQPTTLKAIAIKDGISSEVAEMVITESVWTIASTADGTRYFRIRCATTGQTLTAAGGAEIKLEIGGTWGTSVEIPAGATSSTIYFRGNGIGGTLTFPSPELVTFLQGSGATTRITGSITGMELAYLYLSGTGTSITGVPPAIGKTLSSLRIAGGTSYDYPWTEQTFDPTTKRTWTATTMAIDCVAAAPTPAQFNTWLLGLASVSNAGTATLTLKNTPTLDEMTTAGLVGAGSGYYAMTTTLGYTLNLGS